MYPHLISTTAKMTLKTHLSLFISAALIAPSAFDVLCAAARFRYIVSCRHPRPSARQSTDAVADRLTVKARRDAGQSVKFTYRVNDNAGVGCLELAKERSVSKQNNFAFLVRWTEHWANEVEFVFE